MSRAIGTQLKNHLMGTTTTVAHCLRVTRVDGTEYFFTDYSEDLTVDGDTYESSTGFMPSAERMESALSVDNMEITAAFSNANIRASEIEAGLYDGATVDVFLVNHQNLSHGKLWLAKGWTVGRIEQKDVHFVAEIRGKAEQLDQQIVELTTPTCRAALGDARCGVDLDDSAGTYRHEGTVTSVTDARVFKDTSVPSSVTTDVFANGRLVWTSGTNSGLEMEIRSYDVGTSEFELLLPMGKAIDVGDNFTAYWGCDKRPTTCKNTFSNYDNFRGEPDTPTPDEMLEITTP